METTGQRIKAARIAAGMTQQELADKVGVKYAAIHKYESGLVVNLKRDTIAKLASALDVQPTYLLCIEDEESTDAPLLTEDEQKLLDGYRELSEQGKEYILQTLEIARLVYIKNHAVSNVEKNA